MISCTWQPMKKSLAKLTFKGKLPESIKKGFSWWTATNECVPNDWSIRIVFTEDPKKSTIMAEIDFLMPTADYLLKPGIKFKLFPGATKCEWEVEVVKEL